MLGFLLFVLVLLVLTIGPVVGLHYLSKALGWGFHRRPMITGLVAGCLILLLVCSFGWLFPGCAVTGLGFHGMAIVHCPR